MKRLAQQQLFRDAEAAAASAVEIPAASDAIVEPGLELEEAL
jgi:hypothetical protein